MKSSLWAIGTSVALVAIIVGALYYFDVHEELLHLIRWVERQEGYAALLFVVMMAIAVVLLLPGIFFTIGAGFVFGVALGSVYVVLGTTLGAAISFLIARYLFGQRAARFVREHEKLGRVNEEMQRHDFKVVLFSRLIPFFPGKLSNYFFGLTRFSFRNYLLATLIGLIPFSVHNVYLGSIAADLSSLTEAQTQRSPMEWLVYSAGFLITLGAVFYFNRLARRALADYQPELNDDEALQ